MISWKIIEGLYSYQSIPLPINRISEFVDILLTLVYHYTYPAIGSYGNS